MHNLCFVFAHTDVSVFVILGHESKQCLSIFLQTFAGDLNCHAVLHDVVRVPELDGAPMRLCKARQPSFASFKACMKYVFVMQARYMSGENLGISASLSHLSLFAALNSGQYSSGTLIA